MCRISKQSSDTVAYYFSQKTLYIAIIRPLLLTIYICDIMPKSVINMHFVMPDY